MVVVVRREVGLTVVACSIRRECGDKKRSCTDSGGSNSVRRWCGDTKKSCTDGGRSCASIRRACGEELDWWELQERVWWYEEKLD